MSRRAEVVMTILGMGVVLVGVAQARGNAAAPPTHSVFAAAPAASRNRENPYANNGDAVPAGRKLYLANCASCHGENSKGTKHGPSLISELVARATPGEMEWFLRNGSMRRGMPSWSGLPEQRRWQIAAYLKSQQTD